MADQPIKLTPLGNLDKDTEYKFIKEGNYVDALDVIKQDDEGQVSGTIQPTKRNKHAFSLGEVVAQNKKYRITVVPNSSTDGNHARHAISIKSIAGDAMINYNGILDYPEVTDGTAVQFTSTITGFQQGWADTTNNNLFNVTYPTLPGQTYPVIEIELINYAHYDYKIESVGPDLVKIECIQEAIPTDLAGPLKDIGSYDLFGDLFVFSTTQDNEPTLTDLKVAGVGPLTTIGGQSYFTGPVTTISFTTPHNLQVGQSFRITDSNQTFLNGDFVVNSVSSPTEIGVVTSTAWGNNYPVSSGVIGQEKITIHNKAIGEIGVGQKDNPTETWTYKKLLRSIQLNFITKYNIDCAGEKDNRRSSFYFEDDFNKSRVFYYSGEYLEGGALSHVSSDNYYNLDYINIQTASLKAKANVFIDLKEQRESGGDTPSGNIRYFCLLEDQFGNIGKPSDLSSIVITYSDNITGIAVGDGDDTTNTNKVNVLTISSLNPILHKKIRLGYYVNIQGASSAYLLGEEDVVSTSMDIPHVGSCGLEEYDVGNLATNFLTGYDFAKNINVVDERLVRSNLRKKQISDFTAWAKSFKHRIKEKFIIGSSVNTAGEYQLAENGFDSLGYMLNETYRFAVRGTFKDTGEYTPWFWVDDIKVDPFLTNEGNPNDNRRDQSGSDILTDFDLTKSLGGAYPTTRHAKVPYVEFFDIDKTFNIDGLPINLLIDTIEFGRAEVIPEVLCSGIATLSVRFNGFQNKYYRYDGDRVPFTPDDHGRSVSFPFDTLDVNGNASMKYFITEPGDTFLDNVKPNYEYPFVYGPPSMKYDSAGVNPNYPIGAVDQTPIYKYPSDTETFFGDPVTVQTETENIFFTPWVSERRLLSLYSPDIIYGKVEDISGYQVLDFGEMLLPTNNPSETFNGTFNAGGRMWSLYSKYFPENFSNTFNTYDIDDWRDCSPASKESFGGVTFRKGFGVAFRNSEKDPMFVSDDALVNIKSPVLYVDNDKKGILNQGKNDDYAARYIQLYKKIEDKYCSHENTTYYRTNDKYLLSTLPDNSGIIPKGVCTVFGGDTFTQCTYLKGRYMNWDVVTSAGAESWSEYGFPVDDNSYSPGFAGAFKFYSQNRVNSQMRFADDNEITFTGNTENKAYWLDEDEGKTDLLSYASKFTPTLTGLGQPSYQGQYLDEIFDYPQRIEYSERKIRSSMADDYLNRLPLNIKDLDLTFGEIIHHANINGELFTIQPRKYQLQYFNTRGTLQGSNSGVDVLIGDASVLSRDGQTLSSYGTSHKWSVIKGSSAGGKDVIYWFNQENGLFMRFGADGTIVLSERHGLRSFAANDTKWTEGKHTPALDYGIRSIWDDRFKEAIWTFTGIRASRGLWKTSEFSLDTYNVGDSVTNGTYTNYPFDQIPDVYVCIQSHTPAESNQPGSGTAVSGRYWRLVEKDDPEYYSVFTLAFNELSNGFSTFYSHLPKTYLKWKNKFLSSNPLHRSEMYEHRYGYDKWYEYEGSWKESEPLIEGVVNYIPEQSKKFVAIQSLSDNVPDRIELTTKDHESFLVSSDFDPEDDAWRSPVKNDILTSQTSDPNDDTASLFGSYMRVRFKFFNGAYNKLNNLIVKIRARLRRTAT